MHRFGLSLLAVTALTLTLSACKAVQENEPQPLPAIRFEPGGVMTTTVSRTVSPTLAAANAAIDDLQLKHVSSDYNKADLPGGSIFAKTHDGRPIAIYVKQLDKSSSEIRIKVGDKGDAFVSQQVLDAIRKRL